MNWREQLQQWIDRPGWRTHAPAAGSVLAHIAVAAVFAGMMAAVTAEDAPRSKPEKRSMSVELVQLPAPPLEAGVTPPPRVRPEPTPKRPSSTPADKRKSSAPATSAPIQAGVPDDDTFYVPSSPNAPTGVANGLASLMGDDPCVTRHGPKARECAGRDLAKRTGPMDSMLPRPKEQLARYFAEFMPKCTMRVGCEGGEWISLNGTRSVAKPPPGSRDDHGAGSMMAGGAASVAGPNTIVGRLGFNAEHTDPGFGD